MPRTFRSFFAAILAFFASDVSAQVATPPPPSPIAAIVDASPIAGAHIGIVVTDSATGRVLYEHQADEPLNPASNAKIITAAVALSVIGPDHRFSTSLRGQVSGNAITGSLSLVGGGDPSLSTGDLFEMARQLASFGVRQIHGDLVVDDRAFGTEHLPPAFDQRPHENAAFRAAVSGLSIDENAVTLRVAPGPRADSPASVSIDPPGYVEIENHLITSTGSTPNVQLDLAPLPNGREHARVAGSIPVGSPVASYRRRLANPSLAAGLAMQNALQSAGISLHGHVVVSSAATGGSLLVEHQSEALSALLYRVGKDSDNFYAEMTLLAIALADNSAQPVTFRRAVDREFAWLHAMRIDTAGMQIQNGSGLYDANRVSVRQLAQVLRVAWRDPAIRDEYIAQLSVAGDDGTLHNRLHLANADRWVRAKTGTLDDVIALSGYVLAPDPERSLIFSIVANGVHGHQSQARDLADHIVAELVRELSH